MAPVRSSRLSAVRWNTVSLIGRQVLVLTSGLIVARLIGPEAYGVVGLATVYIAFASLILDQGVSSALIARRTLTPATPGAAVSLNIALSLSIGAVTAVLSGPSASFFVIPELQPVLIVLGGSLVVKSLAIVPRAMLSRDLNFRPVGLADLVGSLIGAFVAVAIAVLGGSYWALIAQTIASDLIVAIILLLAYRGPLPNLSLRSLPPILAFGLRTLVANLFSTGARNLDNVVIGRSLGSTSLGQYALAYRVLQLPVQMLGISVSRVLFPAIAQDAENPARIRETTNRATRMLAFIAVPGMALIAAGAPAAVPIGLGNDWSPAVPVLQILAATGARQAVYSVTAPLMLGLGRADLHLRFSLAAATGQMVGIVAGIPFGILGVAVGYSVAGFLFTPVMIEIQRHLIGSTRKSQLACVLPPLHAAAWAIIGYCAVLAYDSSASGIVAATFIGSMVYVLVLGAIHKSYVSAVLRDARLLVLPGGKRKGTPEAPVVEGK